MVGAIADWFAVVALFKHPLGLPIPHTALSRSARRARPGPRGVRRRELPAGGDHPGPGARRRVPHAGRDWLRPRATPAGWSTRSRDVAAIGLEQVRDEDVADLVEHGAGAAVPRGADRAARWAASSTRSSRTTRTTASSTCCSRSATTGWTATRTPSTTSSPSARRGGRPRRSTSAVIHRLHAEIVEWLADIRADPPTTPALALDTLLAQLADGLLHDPDTIDRMERSQGCGSSSTRRSSATCISLWNALRNAPLAALQDPDGALADRLAAEVVAFGERLRRTTPCAARLDERPPTWRLRGRRATARELTSVITHTIDQWDGKEASRKIELQVGRTCSSSGSTAPSSVDSSACSSTPSRCSCAGIGHEPSRRVVPIRDESIRLGQFLKLADLVDNGSDAKLAARPTGWSPSTARSRPGAGASSSWATSSPSGGSRPGSPRGDAEIDVPW